MRRVQPIDLVDILVYVVVLGLFVQFFPAVISESFAVTVVTAVLLKIVLEIVVTLKKLVVSRFRSAQTAVGKVVSALGLIVVMAGSKFVVLILTQLIFGGSVKLGGFFLVAILIVTLMLARAGVRRIFTAS